MTTSRQAAERVKLRLCRLMTILSLPCFFLVWEVVSRSGVVNQLLFPAPSVIATSLLSWAKSGELTHDFLMSLSRVVVGYFLGATTGMIIGVLTGRHQLLSAFLSPIFQLLRPIPPIAFVPIVILCFWSW